MRFSDELSDAQRMRLHSETLYRFDANGRLRTINEPGFPNAPRFWMGRTREGNQWRFRHDLPPATLAALEELCQAEPVPTDLQQPLQCETAIRAVLAAQAPIRSEYRGPAYWISENTEPSSQVTLISGTNAELLRPHFADLLEPDAYHQLGPVAAVITDGCAVAVCFCSRIPGRATEAGANTHPDYRRRGYVSAAVASWAAAVYQQDCLPLYSTSWENLASQGVARKLGMRRYGEDWSVL